MKHSRRSPSTGGTATFTQFQPIKRQGWTGHWFDEVPAEANAQDAA
jgi:hypothetical protein